MLIKGLQYSGGHPVLEKRLNQMADLILKSVNSSLEACNLQASESTVSNANASGSVNGSKEQQKIHTDTQLKDARIKLERWIDDIEKHPFLNKILTAHTIGKFHRLNGTMLARENNFIKAVEKFDKALFFVDDNPEYYLLKADACFAVNDYENGINALNKAVKLDVKYAVYWENMGDNLADQGKFNDAIAAYEQFFAASSENKMVLKKISQCFVGLGQLQAAKDILIELKRLCG